MATSFNGWGSSWGQTWDRISDPGAMYGSASFSITASGTLTGTGSAPSAGGFGKPRYVRVPVTPVRDRIENEEALLMLGLI